MSWQALYIYGASGHGKVVADVCRRAGLAHLEGFVDDGVASSGLRVLGLPVLGDGEWLQAQARKVRVAVALGIGDNGVRRRVAARCEQWSVQLVTPVHPSASIADSVTLGAGTVVMAGAAINPDSQVGEGAIINTGAVVEHDNEIGAYAHLSANSATGGNVAIGAASHVGLGAVVLPGVTIGDNNIVGAGAVVLKDLPANVVAVGVPARVIR